MTTKLNSIQSSTIQKTLWSRKATAFIVVALACFLLVSLSWPLSVRTHICQGRIEVDVIKTPAAVSSFKRQLTDIVQRHTAPKAVAQLANEVLAISPNRSLKELSTASGFPSRFGVRLNNGDEQGIFRLNVTYRGKGTQSENYMVNLLTTNIARDFLTSPDAQLGTGKIRTPQPASPTPVQTTEDQADHLSERATALLARLESGSQNNSPNRFAKTSATPFMNVAHSSTRPGNPTSGEIAELKNTIDQLKDLANRSPEIHSAENSVSFSVRSVSAEPIRPINGVPKLPHILLLSGISGLFATLVTIAYRPFENTGFENIASVVQKLGVPVVATLGDTSTDSDSSNSPPSQRPWANHIVQFAELTLFVVTIIAISFCVVNSEIRAAFSDNLYHGFARIAWMFQN